MRSFTNRSGERIEVGQEFLDTAIRIMEELMNESPSRRVNWSRHKKMMEIEGFESDSNEAFRQMMKAERRSRGILPSAKTYAELASKSTLESIKEEIGELSYAKRDAQNQFRQLNKVKRELTDDLLFVEEIKEQLKTVSFDEKFRELKPVSVSTNHMVVSMSDWHIGLKTEEFNYSVARDRAEEYADKIVKYANLFNISNIYVLGCGDLVNGSYMRPNQPAENEFNFSEQIVKATEIVFEFLQYISMYLNVEYVGSIIGNHSRMASGSKSNNIDNDNAENIIDAVIKQYISMSKNPRLSVKDSKIDNYSISFSLGDVKFKAVHGDLISKKSTEKLQKFISSDQVFYNVLLYGHYHHSSYVEENHGRLALGAGCLQGTTEYSKQLGYETVPSQTIVVVDGDNTVIPIRIPLGVKNG